MRWEKFAVPTTDGTGEIDAWIMRPDGFEARRKYPLLLNVHGGPFTQYGEYFFDEAQVQAAAGFAVLMCNPRGGSGRDTGWGQAILGPKHPVAPGSGWGTVDVDDILAVLDAALARYRFLDADRVGMLGGSYGGYIATWLAGRHSERFRAICSERAVNNMLSEEWASDIGSAFRIEIGPTHIEDPDEYARMSPIRWVRDIDVPLLIIHSENDLRCPIVQAEELFVAMRTARQGRHVLPLPRRGARAVPIRLAGAPADARRDHPRLLRREAGAPPQAPRRDYGTVDPPRHPIEISSIHSSMSRRAIEIGGGIIGSSSRRYHPASTISAGSRVSSPSR